MVVEYNTDATERRLQALRRELAQSSDGQSPSPDPTSDLVSTIEHQVIPRLVLAHASESYTTEECRDGRMPPTAEEIAHVADLSVAQDVEAILGQVELMSRAGLSLESLLLDLLSPAARLLGDQWLEDVRTFTEVTIGLGTLQRVVAVLGRGVEPPVSHRGLVILMAAPGEQHTLAVQLLGELLRKAGWGAHVDPALGPDELLDMVASQRVTMVGLSISNTRLVAPMRELIVEVKRQSINQDIAIMLGGAADMTDIAHELGAMYCSSARDAIDWLDHRACGADGVVSV